MVNVVCHVLKTIQPFFDDVWVGIKPFEIRKADRPYAVGHTLVLREYLPGNERYEDTQFYTGRAAITKVTYLLLLKEPWSLDYPHDMWAQNDNVALGLDRNIWRETYLKEAQLAEYLAHDPTHCPKVQ